MRHRKLKDRIWTYAWDTWREPPFFPRRARFIPFLGEDEFGYRTLVFPVPFVCQVVVAFRYCGCSLEGEAA